MKNDVDDEYYLRRVLGGDKTAYGEIIRRYKAMAFTIAHKILRNREESEDAAQESFIKAYENLESFKFGSNFKTWLYRIVYNTSISEFRKRKPNIHFDAINEETIDESGYHAVNDAIHAFAATERETFINNAIDTLSPEEQLIIRLYYTEDCSLESIAEITGLSKANIKIKLFRSRKKIYSELKNKLKNEVFNLL